MAGDAANAVLSTITEKVITPVVDAIGRQLGYIFFYKRNISNLGKKVGHLQHVRKDAQSLFEAQKWNNEEKTETSGGWLKDVEEVTKAAKEVVEATNKLKGCFLNLKDRYVLSRKSTKLAEEMQKLQVQAPKGNATKPAPPAGMLPGSSSNHGSTGYKSRTEIIDNVMEALKDDKINFIGICGLGGVGKTTILHEVRERARIENLFDEVAMTTVSQDQNLFKIQSDLAGMLGLTSINHEGGIIARADVLHKRLTNGRRILVVLDDIWSEIKLDEVGIPVGNDCAGCKVVLASRQEGVCTNMETQKNISVDVLSEKEAWEMFKKTAGDCVERYKLEEIARDVARECGGLPIALVTLARALSNKKRAAWIDARKQLRQSSVTRIPEMNKNVYSSIKLSYDFLASELSEAQILLLLCCQHPEDSNIQVEKLVRYCLALELFKNVNKVEDTRNTIYALIDHLKSCFLLQEGDIDDRQRDGKYETVKMHDVVRDVCLSIVSRVKEERDKVHMHFMHFMQQRGSGDGYQLGTSEVDFPKIKLLLIYSIFHGDLPNTSFLQQMRELKVLEYFQCSVTELQVLTNLRMLAFDGAYIDEDTMSKIGRLSNLEILIFSWCKISSFPRQIGQLRNLKLLDLTSRSNPSPIPSGILPGLSKLEELYMGSYHFPKTPKNGEECVEGETYGHVAELDSLSNLTSLQIRLSDPMDLLDLQQFCFEKLERYCFGTVHGLVATHFNPLHPFVEKSLELERIGVNWILGTKVQFLVRSATAIWLNDIDWADTLSIREFVNLRSLDMGAFNQLEYIIHDDGAGEDSSNVFVNLERLTISEMNNLRELCHNGHLPPAQLHNLQELCISRLPKIRCLWVGPTDPLCLGYLKKVDILYCPILEYIFPHSAAKCLVQLQILRVRECNMLVRVVSKGALSTSVGEIIESNELMVQFPKLRELDLQHLRSLRGFYNLADDGRVQPLFNPLVMLPSLVNLNVEALHQLKQIVGGGMLLPKFVASDWLQNLESVSVGWCDSLQLIFDFEGQEVMAENARNVIVLGKLQKIKLRWLPNLTHIFCCRMHNISIPELREIHVEKCGNLVNLVASDLISLLQNLKRLVLVNCESIKVVFDFDRVEVMRENVCVILGKLEDITLRRLPALENVCRLVPKEIQGFQNLKSLKVDACGSLSYLLSSSISHMLRNLERLSVENCKSMKEVIKINEDDGEKKIVFRSLHRVEFLCLEKLLWFCSSDLQQFEFPSLEQVLIVKCPEIKSFCSGHLTAKKLQGVYFAHPRDDDKPVWKTDLNETIRHFNTSVNLMNLRLTKDGLGDDHVEDVNDFLIAEEDVGDGYFQCGNEGNSWDLKTPPPQLINFFTNASEQTSTSSTYLPLISDENEELSYSPMPDLNKTYSSIPDLNEAVFPHLIELFPSDKNEELSYSPMPDLNKAYSSIPDLNEAVFPHLIELFPSDENEELSYSPMPDLNKAYSSIPDLNEAVFPHLIELFPSALAGQSVHFTNSAFCSALGKNSTVNLMDSGLKEDGVGDNDADAIHVSDEGVGNKYAQCGNEGPWKPRKSSLIPQIISSPDDSLGVIASSAPAVIDDNEELAYLSSSPHLRKAASPPRIGLPHCSASTQFPSLSSDSLLQSEGKKALSDSPVQLEKLVPSSSGHETDSLQDEVIITTTAMSMVAEKSDLGQNLTGSKLKNLYDSRKGVPKAIEVRPCSLDEVAQNGSGCISELDHHTAGQAGKADVSDALASWEGHKVTRGEKDLLEAVKKHFPDTFGGVNFHSEVIWKVALDTFCCCLLKFLVANVYDLSSKEVAELRAMLLDLETFKFKVNWALDRLEKVEKLRFGSPFPQEVADIDHHRAPLLAKVEHLEANLASAKVELGDLDVLRETKIKALFNEFGGDGLYLLEGSLGRGLLPSYQSG